MIDFRVVTEGSGLDVTAALDGSTLAATFTGTAEMTAFEPMKSVIAQLHAKAVAAKVSAVVVDFTQLEFMSSSCFKTLVTWISDVTELAEGTQYKIRFRSSTAHLWQRRSLHVLQTFATDLVSIES